MKCIIGLGNGGCAIVTKFAELDDYKNLIRIDVEKLPKNKKCIDLIIPVQRHPEDYENNIPTFSKLSKIKEKTVVFFVVGSGSISLSSLKILEQIKEKDIEVVYIKPDLEFVGAEAKEKEKLVFNVFQEYARSGLFKKLYILSNINIEKVLGGISIIDYFDKINECIVSTFSMLDRLKNSKAVATTISTIPLGARISTIGLHDLEENEDKLFFQLDDITDSLYYFAYNELQLKEDKNLLSDIRNIVKTKSESGKIRVSYAVFATNYSNSLVVCEVSTSIIQNN